MKTLLHVIPSLTGGGAERQLALLAAEQGRRGWKVHIALRRRGNYARLLERSGVVTHELGDLRRGHPLLFARLHSVVRAVRPDILQTWLLQMDLVGGAVALANRTPWVMTERCSRENYDEFPVSGRLRTVLGRRAQVVVANSNEGAAYWRAIRAGARGIVTVNNAVDAEAVRSVEARFFDEDPRPTLLCVGRLETQKAHDVLLQALRRIPRDLAFRVLVLGNGSLEGAIRRQIDQLGLGECVRLLPYQESWWGYLKTATGLLNPSRFEGQPNVVLEAMAAGCPLIVSDIGAHREFLDDSTALFVRPDDPDDLARAITALLSNAGAAAARANNATARVAQLDIPVIADSYERVYAGL